MPESAAQIIFDAIFVTTIAVAALVLALIAGLLILKNIRIYKRRHEEKIRQGLEPALENCLAGKISAIPEAFLGLRGGAAQVLKYVLIRRSFGTAGAVHESIARIYERAGFIEQDRRALRGRLWWRRAEAARCLGQMRHKPAVPWLLNGLEDPALEARLLCAWALGRIGEPATVRPILEHLAGVSKLAGMRLSSTVFELGEKAVAPLIDITGHPEIPVRLLAVHLLAEFKNAEILPVLIGKSAEHESKEVRIAACKALGTAGRPEGVPRLIELLSSPELWELRAQAAKALGPFQTPAAVAPLSRALEDKQWWVRRNAGEALVKTGPSGLAALREIQQHSKDRFAREMAGQWLDEYDTH